MFDLRHDDGAQSHLGNAKFGRLDKALDAAPAVGWSVIDMKDNWKTIFPPQ